MSTASGQPPWSCQVGSTRIEVPLSRKATPHHTGAGGQPLAERREVHRVQPGGVLLHGRLAAAGGRLGRSTRYRLPACGPNHPSTIRQWAPLSARYLALTFGWRAPSRSRTRRLRASARSRADRGAALHTRWVVTADAAGLNVRRHSAHLRPAHQPSLRRLGARSRCRGGSRSPPLGRARSGGAMAHQSAGHWLSIGPPLKSWRS